MTTGAPALFALIRSGGNLVVLSPPEVPVWRSSTGLMHRGGSPLDKLRWNMLFAQRPPMFKTRSLSSA